MKRTLFLFIILITRQFVFGGEGMWLPVLLSQLNEKEMHDMGMHITADDIYSVNHSSLKDAVVLFGGGCTAELVSDKGLLLTNHHCGYSNIQRHSSLNHDYLTDGFWALSLSEELPNPGLSVTFLVSMKEVTNEALAGVNPKMTEAERDARIKQNAEKIVAESVKGTHYKGSVKAFFNGNQYYLFITETFTDIRLVGAPPSSIGKFGGDTDNWMWPRHTGDFSVFRIYAGKDNEPADYSKENIPYQPKMHFTISLKGVHEGDFTFVYGFPGSTQEYLPSSAVDMAANLRNPIAIDLRQQRLDIIDKAMESDKLVRIQYSAKAASIANFWKKMIGESKGIKMIGGIEQKQAFEKEFTNWVNADPALKARFGLLLPSYFESCNNFRPYHKAYTYLTESALSVEALRYAAGFGNLVQQCKAKSTTDEEISKTVGKLSAGIEGSFKNYNAAIDKKVFIALMGTYGQKCDKELLPGIFSEAMQDYKGNYSSWAEDVFNTTFFDDPQRVTALLKNFKRKDYRKIEKDPAYRIAISVYSYLQNVLTPIVSTFYTKADSMQRLYMAAQMEMQPSKRFYPDANSTLRVAYGNIKSYSPTDAVDYSWFTTLDGIMQKENPDIYDYKVEPKLKELSKNKDYGEYGDADGSLHVAFIASNHTTGGNSGSPVLDADGYLIGINFDRCWEGTMSDLMYDPDHCRNISLDIRYCLFVIDKFAGAERLIKEMSIVKN
jgi:hypothetical protein